MVTFTSKKVSDRVTRIRAPKEELIYLVEGEQKAALLDSGCGFGSLRTFVRTLTDKPLFVLNTHGHFDHVMGSGEFEEVYLNHADDYIYLDHMKREVRMEELMRPPLLPDFDETTDYIEALPLTAFKDLKEGDTFDLGGISVEIFEVPGHTRGSLAMLIPEERMLLTGDAVNNMCFMFDYYSTSIEEYRESLRAFAPKVAGRYDRVLASHGPGDLRMGVVEESIDVCEDILTGTADDMPFEFMDFRGILARTMDMKTFTRPDGLCANIVYSKEKVCR